ncbi:MAG: hypothetical protein AAFO96_02730 [Bacteroidota bacterium]
MNFSQWIFHIWSLPILALLLGAHPTDYEPSPEICVLTGRVFVTTDRQMADYRVAKLDEDAPADLLVFEETLANFDARPGHWHFTSSPAAADFIIYWESQPEFADFTLSITPFWDEAGCSK